MLKTNFYTQNLFSKDKFGPYNQEGVSVLVGHLLGDGYGEKRKNKTLFQIHIKSRNAEYVFWSFKFFAEKGYSSPKKPVLKKHIGKKNSIYFSILFKTYSFSSYNFLYDSFYPVKIPSFKSSQGTHTVPFLTNIERDTKKKRVPTNIYSLLTQQALAIWIMDMGIPFNKSGFKISLSFFSLEDTILLQKTLKTKFSIEPCIQRHKTHSCANHKDHFCAKDKYNFYFQKNDILSLYSIVKPYILPCMRYKFNVETLS